MGRTILLAIGKELVGFDGDPVFCGLPLVTVGFKSEGRSFLLVTMGRSIEAAFAGGIGVAIFAGGMNVAGLVAGIRGGGFNKVPSILVSGSVKVAMSSESCILNAWSFFRFVLLFMLPIGGEVDNGESIIGGGIATTGAGGVLGARGDVRTAMQVIQQQRKRNK